MSDSWICWKPRIDEPSNIRPSVKTLSPKFDAGNVKCCITPGRSQNRTSMNWTSFFLMKERTSSALSNMRVLPPSALGALLGPAGQDKGRADACNVANRLARVQPTLGGG